jgi:hypothetical protein
LRAESVTNLASRNPTKWRFCAITFRPGLSGGRCGTVPCRKLLRTFK